MTIQIFKTVDCEMTQSTAERKDKSDPRTSLTMNGSGILLYLWTWRALPGEGREVGCFFAFSVLRCAPARVTTEVRA